MTKPQRSPAHWPGLLSSSPRRGEASLSLDAGITQHGSEGFSMDGTKNPFPGMWEGAEVCPSEEEAGDRAAMDGMATHPKDTSIETRRKGS